MPDDVLVHEMVEYYRARAPWHDEYMSYQNNETMEELLAPIIGTVDPWLCGRDVLEIACGTGNWTQILARRARSILATDINQEAIQIALRKDYFGKAVGFTVADAYSLDELKEAMQDFTGAFASDWWSHIPKSRIPDFLKTLSGKLAPGAAVVFLDILPRDHPDLRPYRRDEQGNQICRRRLPDGREFSVVKNFPTRQELLGCLKGFGEEIRYYQWFELGRWGVAFHLREDISILQQN